jgi:hypothetical protein
VLIGSVEAPSSEVELTVPRFFTELAVLDGDSPRRGGQQKVFRVKIEFSQ